VRGVPMDEILRRLARVRTLADGGADTLEHAWKTRDELKRLVNWGLNQPEPRIKKVMLGLIRIAGDEDARWMLRYALLSTEHSDEFKQEILETLFELGDLGPHYMANSKGFGAAYVQIAQESEIPKAQDDALVEIAKSMPEIPDVLAELRAVWQILIREESLLVEIDHWMTAVEYFIRAKYGLPVPILDRRSLRRVHRIEQLTGNGDSEGAAGNAASRDKEAKETADSAGCSSFALDAFPTFEGWLDAQESESVPAAKKRGRKKNKEEDK